MNNSFKMILVALGLALVTPATVSAYEVVFPNRLKPKAQVQVDAQGAVLFGDLPARVEITNLPEPPVCETCEVCEEADTGTPWQFVKYLYNGIGAVEIFTVPVGMELQLTSIDVMLSTGGAFSVYLDAAPANEPFILIRNTSGGTYDEVSRRYDAPLVIGEGVVISTPVENSNNHVTMIGRLVPVP